MKVLRSFTLLFVGLMLWINACTREEVTAPGAATGVESGMRAPVASLLGPEVALHYLGHSAFILRFDNGVTILTDDGETRSYGPDSPVHDIGDVEPTIVIYAHHYAASTRSRTFPGAQIVSGRDCTHGEIEIRAIPVTEERPGDNYGYLITYKGFTIFYAGDSQGDMLALDSPDVRMRLKGQLPGQLDLLLVPIDWKQDITLQAVSYVDFLRPKRVIPMHYWSPEVKARFLDSLEETNRGYYIVESDRPDCRIFVTQPTKAIEVISLNAGPVIGI